MASKAAIDGVSVNGLAWRKKGPRIRELCKHIGAARDGKIDDAADIAKTSNRIASLISKWLETFSEQAREDFYFRHEEDIEVMAELTVGDVEEDAEGAVEEVVYALDQIYDTFDFDRVLVQ